MFGTTSTPIASHDGAKPRRSRAIVLTHVDRRSPLGRRIKELTAIYTAALGSSDLSEIKRLKVDEAAQLKAMAEKARGDWMRDGEASPTLEDIVRLERKASAAERDLGIERQVGKVKSSLLAALAEGAR
jgi:hypothetical protein